jgi:hypothetical protein
VADYCCDLLRHCPAPLRLLPQAVGLDQHVLRTSKLLLPLVASRPK